MWDISKTFLKTDVTGKKFKIYLGEPRLPPGIPKAPPGWVYPLMKNIYGLSRAPRLWYEEFRNCLMEYGFEQSASDLCMFMMRAKGGKIKAVIVLHVDDMLATGGGEE